MIGAHTATMAPPLRVPSIRARGRHGAVGVVGKLVGRIDEHKNLARRGVGGGLPAVLIEGLGAAMTLQAPGEDSEIVGPQFAGDQAVARTQGPRHQRRRARVEGPPSRRTSAFRASNTGGAASSAISTADAAPSPVLRASSQA